MTLSWVPPIFPFMSRRQRPARRLASIRAARRRRQSFAPPERLPAIPVAEAAERDHAALLDYEDLADLSLVWEAD